MRKKLATLAIIAVSFVTSPNSVARLVQKPIYTALFTVQIEDQEELVDSVRQFAADRGLDGQKHDLRPETHQISIHLTSEEMEVSIINENNGTRYHFGIFDIGDEEMSLTELNDIVTDLQERLLPFGNTNYLQTKNELE